MSSFYTNKKNIKNNDEYTDTYNEKQEGHCLPDNCISCSYNGETIFDCYLCAKNPYKLFSVSCNGHCKCFSDQKIAITKLEKFFLNLKGFEFRYKNRIK